MPEETPPEGGYTPPASQADLDRIISERLTRERQKFSDYDNLKAKAAQFDEIDARDKSELQKAQDAVAERDAKLADLPKTVRSQVVRFASAATRKGALDPEDALMFLGDVDLGDSAAVDAALDELKGRKPHLFAPVKRLPARPKPNGSSDGDDGEKALEGKERAAAALRGFKNTR